MRCRALHQGITQLTQPCHRLLHALANYQPDPQTDDLLREVSDKIGSVLGSTIDVEYQVA